MITLKELENAKKITGKIVYADNMEEKARFMKEDENILFIYAKKSRKYGRRVFEQNNELIYNGREIVGFKLSKVPVEERWLKSINKAIRLLEKSGLWTKFLSELKTAKDIGYTKLNKAYRVYWETFAFGYEREKEKKVENIRKIDERLIDKKGDNESINRTILWQMSKPLKIKKMYFGKGYSDNLEKIKKSMDKRESVNAFGYGSYDISFEYNSEKNMAWYSEEYKGCGNGHYYIALDNEYALFTEDD